MNGPIDIVIPWVDGSDPLWSEEKDSYRRRFCSDEKSDYDIRFQSWDNLQYWFRAIEKFMPWVNKVFFVTWGHIPDFMNLDNPKLKIVKHIDYIPQKYLPTFNSNTIEMNLHRIPDLSENFILFNDDTIPLQPIEENYYFKDNQVCDEAVENIIIAKENGPIANMARYTQVNNMVVINRYFQKREVQKRNYDKWFCEDYGDLLDRTKSMKYWNDFPGFYDPHMANALKKSALKYLWDIEEKTLDAASANHFRAYSDVTQYLIRYWQLCEGNFVPRRTLGKMCLVDINNYDDIAEGIKNREWKMVSLNENCIAEDFVTIKEKINDSLKEILPDKSTFET